MERSLMVYYELGNIAELYGISYDIPYNYVDDHVRVCFPFCSLSLVLYSRPSA